MTRVSVHNQRYLPLLSKKIFTPGPTQVPKDVLSAVIEHSTYHRSSEYKDFLKSLTDKLKLVLRTEQNVSILTCSGTGSMETAVVNFCSPGDEVLFVNQGRFGARWGNICIAHGITAKELKVPMGNAIKINALSRIDLSNFKAVFLTHTETSTATLTDLSQIADYIKGNSDALVIVDAITSAGAIQFEFDKWGIDVAILASQKGLMTPPGISVIAYSNAAREVMLKSTSNRFYFDLRKEEKSLAEGFTSWTPAVGLTYGIDKACDIVLSYGLENWWKKTAECAEYARNEGAKMGLKVFSSQPSDSLTAFELPKGIKSSELIIAMKTKYGVQLANGQAELKDRIFRMSHMGDLYVEDFADLMKLIKTELDIILNK